MITDWFWNSNSVMYVTNNNLLEVDTFISSDFSVEALAVEVSVILLQIPDV